jgi:replicative DNA helicase
MARGDTRETQHTYLSGVISGLDQALQQGDLADLEPIPLGFPLLDQRMDGGVSPGDLLVLAGPPGVGKTIAGLQWARNVARSGARAIYVCYEHDQFVLMTRLLALEVGERDPGHSARDLMDRIQRAGRDRQSLDDALNDDPTYVEALKGMRTYADNLVLVRASGAYTTMDDLDGMLTHYAADRTIPTVLFVDYLQKIAVQPEPATESDKITKLVESLKDLALDHHVPIITISAVGVEGMDASRIRLHHLRGSSALAFEADVVVMMNEKMKAISRVHLAYDAHAHEKFRNQIVFTLEKNRGGQNLLDLEFQKDFRHFRFDPDGSVVQERLVSERLDEDAV